MAEPVQKRAKRPYDVLLPKGHIQLLHSKLSDGCLCSLPLSEVVDTLDVYNQYFAACTSENVIQDMENSLLYASLLALFFEVALNQRSRGVLCTRIRDVVSANADSENNVIQILLQFLTGEKYLSYNASRGLVSLLLMVSEEPGELILNNLTEVMLYSDHWLQRQHAFDVVRQVIEWKDLDEHPLQSPEDCEPPVECTVIKLSPADQCGTNAMKYKAANILGSLWKLLVNKLLSLSKNLTIYNEHVFISFISLWSSLVSVKNNLNIGETKVFYWGLEKLVNLLLCPTTSLVVWEKILNLFNEVLCYGSTLALQEVLDEEPSNLAALLINAVNNKKLLEFVPCGQSAGISLKFHTAAHRRVNMQSREFVGSDFGLASTPVFAPDVEGNAFRACSESPISMESSNGLAMRQSEVLISLREDPIRNVFSSQVSDSICSSVAHNLEQSLSGLQMLQGYHDENSDEDEPLHSFVQISSSAHSKVYSSDNRDSVLSNKNSQLEYNSLTAGKMVSNSYQNAIKSKFFAPKISVFDGRGTLNQFSSDTAIHPTASQSDKHSSGINNFPSLLCDSHSSVHAPGAANADAGESSSAFDNNDLELRVVVFRKCVLVTFKAIAVAVKEARGDGSSSSSSSANSSPSYIDDSTPDDDMVIIGKSLLTVLQRLDELVKQRESFHPQCSVAEWLVKLLAAQDDWMVEAMVCALDIYSGLCDDVTGVSNHVAAMLNPHVSFLVFLHTVHYDPSVLLDHLVSNETCFLLYLLRYLKVARRSWLSLQTAIGVEGGDARLAISTLFKLRNSINKLVAKKLFPYNISPVLKLLDECHKMFSTFV